MIVTSKLSDPEMKCRHSFDAGKGRLRQGLHSPPNGCHQMILFVPFARKGLEEGLQLKHEFHGQPVPRWNEIEPAGFYNSSNGLDKAVLRVLEQYSSLPQCLFLGIHPTDTQFHKHLASFCRP